MRVISVILLSVLAGCGTVHTDKCRGTDCELDPNGWITVGQITTELGEQGGTALLLADINFVAGATNKATEDLTGLLTPTEETDILDFGTYGFDTIRINRLSVCGSGSDKCTAARIIAYVSSTNAGFYNTTDGYSVPLLVSGTQLGHTITNANELATYTIPADDRKLTNSDFTAVTFPITVDFSGAGAGSYTASITMVVQVQ